MGLRDGPEGLGDGSEDIKDVLLDLDDGPEGFKIGRFAEENGTTRSTKISISFVKRTVA